MELLKPSDVVPGGWRLGVFVMNTRVMKGYSSEYLREYITYWASKAGLDVSRSSLVPLAFQIPIGTDVGQPWGAWVNAAAKELTATKVYQVSKIPVVFSVDTAPEGIDWYLKTFQGSWAGDVVQAKTALWATDDSYMAQGTWYAAGASWKFGTPAVAELEANLKSIGCELWSGPNAVQTYNPPLGLMFVFRTGTQPITLGFIRKKIGALVMVVDMNAPINEAGISTGIDKLYESSNGLFDTIGEAGSNVADGTSSLIASAGTSAEILGGFMRYLPWILAGGALIYMYRMFKGGKRSIRNMNYNEDYL